MPTVFEREGVATYEDLLKLTCPRDPAKRRDGSGGTQLPRPLGVVINTGGDGRFEVFTRKTSDGHVVEVVIDLSDNGDGKAPLPALHRVGEVSVDTGTFMICDPAYVLPRRKVPMARCPTCRANVQINNLPGHLRFVHQDALLGNAVQAGHVKVAVRWEDEP